MILKLEITFLSFAIVFSPLFLKVARSQNTKSLQSKPIIESPEKSAKDRVNPNKYTSFKGASSELKIDVMLAGLMDASTKDAFDINKTNTQYSTWIFIQSGCEACHKMMSSYKCFKSKKNAVHFVGLMSKPKDLIQDATTHGYKDKVLFAESEIAERLSLAVTPTVLIFKKEKLKYRFDNYMSCKDIVAQII